MLAIKDLADITANDGKVKYTCAYLRATADAPHTRRASRTNSYTASRETELLLFMRMCTCACALGAYGRHVWRGPRVSDEGGERRPQGEYRQVV